MFKFQGLHVYQDGLLFVDEIYSITERWSTSERFGLVDQLRRAASSIVLNIAEGSSRTKKDFGHFIDISRGSCYECVAILTIAHGRKLITDQIYNNLCNDLERLSRSLGGLKKSL